LGVVCVSLLLINDLETDCPYAKGGLSHGLSVLSPERGMQRLGRRDVFLRNKSSFMVRRIDCDGGGGCCFGLRDASERASLNKSDTICELDPGSQFYGYEIYAPSWTAEAN